MGEGGNSSKRINHSHARFHPPLASPMRYTRSVLNLIQFSSDRISCVFLRWLEEDGIEAFLERMERLVSFSPFLSRLAPPDTRVPPSLPVARPFRFIAMRLVSSALGI